MMVFKMMYRELKSSPRFVLIFIINIIIGLSGLSVIEGFKGSFLSELNKNSLRILGADLALNSRVDISKEKIELVSDMLPGNMMTKNISLFSMASSKDNSRLVSVRIVGEEFPFYGEIQLNSAEKFEFINPYDAFVYPEVLIQMNLNIGDTFILGKKTFTLRDTIKDDGQQSFRMGSIAPRIYISNEALKGAELLQKGSTAWYSYFFKLQTPINSAQQSQIQDKLNDTSIEVLTPKESSAQVGRILKYLNDFLGLVSLSGLFLATMGLMYLYRSFLFKRKKDISISKFLGMSNAKVMQVFIGQLLLMSLIGSLISVSITPIFLPKVLSSLNQLLGLNLQFNFSIESLLAPFIIGTVGSTLIGLPLILPYSKASFGNLFSFEDDTSVNHSRWYHFLPVFIFFYLTAIYLCKSFIIGSMFTAVLVVLIVLTFSFGNILLSKLSYLSHTGKLETKLAWGFLTRYKNSTLFIFSTLMISSMMMTLIPQIKDVLLHEVERPLKENGPTAFLFDIQPEQVDELTGVLSNSNDLLVMSPMVRSRLIKINDRPVETKLTAVMTREQEREVRMRNRGVNLSYRDQLDPSETLVEGQWPQEVYNPELDAVAKVTLEKRYAQRLGVGIGDSLEFDILGIPVTTQIVGIREVRWTSFRPNFFILFQKGVLEDAPKTFLSAIRSTNTLEDQKLQMELFKKFPNVSYVDIRRIIDKVKIIMESMSLILKSMSYLVFIVGIMVLFSIVGHQILLRKMNINLFKVLGLNRGRLNKIISREFLIISFFATLCGIISSTTISFVLSKFIFQSIFIFKLETVLFALVLVPAMSAVISYFGTQRVMRSSASEIFSEVS
ncbi:ABC transporter permease [Halobacteriovorax sp. HLS]|uniref:ABC transporter permease n=1 Tax=Halobacteriovorax sp. HLS TaxID=2234000 RepID=UPI000FD91883|nr:FtsX-like permease family protein [Halobacteriovorax sp. HLS]